MFRQAMRYGAGLIALYVVVVNASGFGTVMSKGAAGVSGVTKTLQGR
jgi:hypothetical protein